VKTVTLTLTAVALILVACTGQPTAPVPATAAVPAAAAATTAQGARRVDPGYAAFARSARGQGFRPVWTDGKEHWCRDESSTETRLGRQTCISPPAIADAQGAADEASDPPRKGE